MRKAIFYLLSFWVVMLIIADIIHADSCVEVQCSSWPNSIDCEAQDNCNWITTTTTTTTSTTTITSTTTTSTSVTTTTTILSGNGAYFWSKKFGSPTGDNSVAVAVEPLTNNVIVAGNFSSTIDFGGGTTLTSLGSSDIFIAKYSPTGTLLWAKRFGGTSPDMVTSIVLDSSGNIVITGYFAGTTSFGGSSLTSAGGYDIFIAEYSSSGTHIWSKRFGTANYDYSYGVAVDNSGNSVITGEFYGTITFGGSSLTSSYPDAFLAKFSPTGAHIWSKKFQNSYAYDTGMGVTIDHSDNIVLTGYFNGTIDFGGGPFIATRYIDGISYYSDIFVAKFSSAGTHIWSKSFGATGEDRGKAVAIDSSNNIIVTGNFGDYFYTVPDFGGGTLVAADGYDIFLVKLSASTGAHIWSFALNDSVSADKAMGIAVDAGNNILLTGYYVKNIVLGSTIYTTPTAFDSNVFVVKYSSGGSHIWSKSFGSSGEEQGNGVTVDSSNNVIVTGRFNSTVNFGGGLLTSAGLFDGFLLKLAP